MIVVAAILKENGRILLCRRRADRANALKWEFPGGKVEPNETPEQALERELWEELQITTQTGALFARHTLLIDSAPADIRFYHTRLTGGTPRAIDCSALAWVEPALLTGYDLTDSDARVAQLLAVKHE